eukprot:m.14165 g.14165  ORF g.14165 m.14165 type:complete len:318 (-) comp8301_c0_seq1:406-1359(-)
MAVSAGWLAAAVALLVGTQMVMLIFGKLATQAAPLPLLLCIAQFVTSAGLAGTVSVMQGHGLPIMPRSLWTTVGMLSAVWTAGFVLFNASAAVMSPGRVNLVRCVEPLASVAFGYMSGKMYSRRMLATLIPICGGVLLASFKGGTAGLPPLIGVALAMFSNMCFCLRPIFKHKLQAHPDKDAVDSIGLFFNICCVAVVLLPPFVLLFEGGLLRAELEQLSDAGMLWTFGWNVFMSSIFFFLYQFTQLIVCHPHRSHVACPRGVVVALTVPRRRTSLLTPEPYRHAPADHVQTHSPRVFHPDANYQGVCDHGLRRVVR